MNELKGKDIKYTAEGNKVKVIKKLNDKDYLVNIIYVSEDYEFVSDKAIIESKLYDAPVETWQSKNIREIEKALEEARETRHNERFTIGIEHDKLVNSFYDKLKTMKQGLSKLSPELFDSFVDFLTYKYKYAIVERGLYWHIVDLGSLEAEEYDVNKLPTFSVSVSKNGDLVTKYSYGNCHSVYVTKEEAKKELREILNDSDLDEYDVYSAEKYGIQLDSANLKKYYERTISINEKEILEYKKQILKRRNEIKKAKKELNQMSK